MQGRLQGFGLNVHEPPAAAEAQEVTLPPRETLDLSFDDTRQFSLWVKVLGGLLRRATCEVHAEEARQREERLEYSMAMQAHDAWAKQQDWLRQPLPPAVARPPSLIGQPGQQPTRPPTSYGGAPRDVWSAGSRLQSSNGDPISSLAYKHDEDYDEVVE